MAGAVRDQRTRGPYAAMDRSTPIDRHVLGALDWRAGRVFTEAVSDPASVPFEAFQCTNEEVVASDLEQGGVETVRPSSCSVGTQGLMSAVVHDAATSSQ